MWPYCWQLKHWLIVFGLCGSSIFILQWSSDESWKISLECIVGSRLTKNNGRGFLLILCNSLVTCLTLKNRTSSSSFIRVRSVVGWRLRITTRSGLSSFSWLVWYSAFLVLRNCIKGLYALGSAVCIFKEFIIDLHMKLSTPISSIKVMHSAGKSSTLLINIRGGLMIIFSAVIWWELSGIFSAVVVVSNGSSWSSISNLLRVAKIFFYCFFE